MSIQHFSYKGNNQQTIARDDFKELTDYIRNEKIGELHIGGNLKITFNIHTGAVKLLDTSSLFPNVTNIYESGPFYQYKQPVLDAIKKIKEEMGSGDTKASDMTRKSGQNRAR